MKHGARREFFSRGIAACWVCLCLPGAARSQEESAFTFSFWRDSQVPEMRLHLNIGHAWNKNEDEGYGMGTGGFQPWPPRYQSAEAAGGTTKNDAMIYGGGLEFRQKSTSLWLEYTWERFRDNPTV